MTEINEYETILSDVQTTLERKIRSLNSRFYQNCLKHVTTIDTLKKLTDDKILEESFLIEPFRLYLLENFSKYHIYVIDTTDSLADLDRHLPKDALTLFRDLRSHCKSENFLHNFRKHMNALESNINASRLILKSLESDPPPSYNDLKNMVVVVSSVNIGQKLTDHGAPNIKIKNKLTLNLVLAKHTLRFLQYQDLNRYIAYTKKSDKYVQQSMRMFSTIYDLFTKFSSDDPDTYDRLLLFSGFVLHSLGTTYTSDADLMYITRGVSETKVKDVTESLKQNPSIDCFVYPETSGSIEYVCDLITNPNMHFYFLGLKIINIKSHVRRLYQRATPSAFVDLIMLDKINRVKINKMTVKPCIPIITVDEDEVTVYDESTTEKKIKTTQKYFRDWHNLRYSIDELKSMIKRCQRYPNDPPFFRKLKLDNITLLLDSVLHYSTLSLMSDFFNKTEKKDSSLLVVDDGKVYPRFYPNKTSNIKVVVLEPSESPATPVFLNIASKKVKQNNYSVVPINLCSEWEKTQEQLKSIDNTNYVMINWSTSQLLSDPSIFMKNLERLSQSTNEVTIIFFFVDGARVREVLDRSSRYEVKDENNKTIFGVYKYDQVARADNTIDDQIVVYVRETLRFGAGTLERVTTVDDLTAVMSSGQYELIDTQPISSYISPDRSVFIPPETPNNIVDIVEEGLKLFRYAVFKRTT